jgi:hypothetical protein
MIGLGKWDISVQTGKCLRLKTQKKKSSSRGKSLLSEKESASGSRESAAVHFVQSDLASFSDGTGMSDNDPTVVRTVETLTVAGSDAPASVQEKKSQVFRRDPIPMNVDKALANFCNSSELRRGGDTGKGRVEHRSILQLNNIHSKCRSEELIRYHQLMKYSEVLC